MSKRAFAIALALTFAALGILDLILRFSIRGWSDGWVIAARDPAKVLFHIVILPLAAYVLLRRLPSLRSFRGNWAVVVAGLVLLASGSAIPLSNGHEIFCGNTDPPQP